MYLQNACLLVQTQHLADAKNTPRKVYMFFLKFFFYKSIYIFVKNVLQNNNSSFISSGVATLAKSLKDLEFSPATLCQVLERGCS